MPLSNEDWSEVLGHIRNRVREVGLDDIDLQITLDFRATDDARADFVRYLSTLLSALGERSQSGYRKALAAIQRAVVTQDGDEIQGIEVVVSDADYNIYRASTIDLREQTDLTPLISELHALIADMDDEELLNG